MAFTHTTTRTFSRLGESRGTGVSVTADAEDCRDITVAASASDYAVNLAVDVSLLKSLYMEADKALSIKVNAASNDPQVVLSASDALQWKSTDTTTCPLGTGTNDVTSLLITNANTADATVLYVRLLQDSTVA